MRKATIVIMAWATLSGCKTWLEEYGLNDEATAVVTGQSRAILTPKATCFDESTGSGCVGIAISGAAAATFANEAKKAGTEIDTGRTEWLDWVCSESGTECFTLLPIGFDPEAPAPTFSSASDTGTATVQLQPITDCYDDITTARCVTITIVGKPAVLLHKKTKQAGVDRGTSSEWLGWECLDQETGMTCWTRVPY